MRSALLLIPFAVLGVSCGSSADTTSASTAAPTTATDVVTTTTEALDTTVAATTTTRAKATTTTEAPTTTIEESDYEGIIWDEGTEPTYESTGMTTRVTAMVYVDLSDPDTVGLVQQCADEIQRMGRGDETRCLAVEWSYDVAPDFPNTYDGGGGLSFVGLITPTGRYVESNYGASAPPGTVDNGLSVVFPIDVDGGTLQFATGENSDAARWLKHEMEIPNFMLPIYFD